ncbi:hypothetical protein AB0F81_12680 [Actinoplanes sp. NPDC024001]|uniref:hypothetical protein n=1 Tax=Actinoplanes sp. NPDC024001 TaxID=3154598 RepID=UPI0033DC81D3
MPALPRRAPLDRGPRRAPLVRAPLDRAPLDRGLLVRMQPRRALLGPAPQVRTLRLTPRLPRPTA